MVLVTSVRDYINRMLQDISGMKVLILDSETVNPISSSITILFFISLWRRTKFAHYMFLDFRLAMWASCIRSQSFFRKKFFLWRWSIRSPCQKNRCRISKLFISSARVRRIFRNYDTSLRVLDLENTIYVHTLFHLLRISNLSLFIDNVCIYIFFFWFFFL